MKKKILSFFFIFLLLFIFTACGREKNNNNEEIEDIIDEIKEHVNSNEELSKAQKEVMAESGIDKVYWDKNSKKYHIDPDCPALSHSNNIYDGTVADAFEKGIKDPCRRCIREIE